ncbi:hypothetical protein OJ998_22790 [Solirubrobacter taibaiensis]|nr:hypothetical protein [Solirubrobacter taibaiensis]
MGQTRIERGSDLEPVRPVAAALAPTVPDVSAVLAIQRGAVNHAVSRLLGASGGRRSLARFGVTIDTERNDFQSLVVAKLNIGHRPPGIFGSGEKSHTVAWETFCDGLRLEIVGYSMRTGIDRVIDLIQVALALPSMSREPFLRQAESTVANAVKPADLLQAAKLRALRACHVAQLVRRSEAPKGTALVSALQELAAAYLQLRNSVPLSAVKLGLPEGGADLDPIRKYETRQDPTPPLPAVRTALWGQLDVRAVAKLGNRRTHPREAPGIDASGGVEELQQRIADVVRDHLTTMRSSYPRSFNDSEIAGEPSVATYVDDVIETGSLPREWIKPLVSRIRGANLPGPDGAHRRRVDVTLTDPDKRFAAQIITAPDGTITDLTTGGRPRGVFGTAQGSHVTAWSALVDVVRTAIVGVKPNQARVRLVALGQSYRTPARATSFNATAAFWIAHAVDKFDRAVALDNKTPDLARAQALASSVLGLLNAQPLSAVQSGGPANSAREAQHRAAALAANVGAAVLGEPARWEVIQALWGLCDVVAVENLLEELDDDAHEKDERPGTVPGEEPTTRAADAISKHVTLMTRAYPDAVRRSAFSDADSLMYLLAVTKLALSKRASVAIAVAAGHARLTAETAYDNQVGKHKRKLDDDDNPTPKKKSKKNHDDESFDEGDSIDED